MGRKGDGRSRRQCGQGSSQTGELTEWTFAALSTCLPTGRNSAGFRRRLLTAQPFHPRNRTSPLQDLEGSFDDLPDVGPVLEGCSPAPPPAWLDVWLEAGREGQVFTYGNPTALGVDVGDLVRVRLLGRLHVGLVVGTPDQLSRELSGKEIKPIEAVIQRAAVDPLWRRLVLEVAEKCHTSLFRTLKSALPPGWLGHRPRREPAAARSVLQVVPTERGREVMAEAPGQLPGRQEQVMGELLRHGEPMLLRDLVSLTGGDYGVVRTLEAKGLLRREPRSGDPPGEAGPASGVGHEPSRQASPAQARAVQAINGASAGETFLLWGVTGAGKTEVYLQSGAHELAAGHSVLLLVPEIGLVPQLHDRARARFGGRVITYHSGMTDRERVSAWRRCLRAADGGNPIVAVGTRSAVFLPLRRLGLIVLDEEHDTSYKQDSPMPCYHAREVARLRARASGARLVLGSATPSLETWQRCQPPAADTRVLHLPERIGARPLPSVHVVDMRMELAEGHRRLLSRALLGRLLELKGRGEQAVVLVPRRGYRSFLSCRSCGEAVLCPHCDVALTVHRHSSGGEWLRCHWCDHRQEVGRHCGHCGSSAFRPFGAGTQRVMERLSHDLEGLRLLRFDQDTTRGRDGHRRVLEAFAAGEADVLVGTQMLAKGMDLPRVTLAAVLAADGLLHRPDLRSAEQCLQLLLQLAGRAGRGERPGEVLVQTYCPDHPVISHLVDGRYGQFLEEESQLRRHGGLVPFSRACLLRLAGPSASVTATAASALVAQIQPGLLRDGWSVVGPAPAPVARVAGRSRWQILLHGPIGMPVELERLPLASEGELRAILPRGVTLAIDPDPVHL